MMHILRPIDQFLNSITMYRLVMYGLAILSGIAVVLSFFSLLPFTPVNLILSLFFLTVICMGINYVFAKLLRAPTNVESSIITALILFLILNPAEKPEEYLVLFLAGMFAMASKYIFNIKGKHVFNPVAIAAVILGAIGFGMVSWWAGSTVLLVPVTVLGLLIVRKIRRFQLFFAFLIAALISLSIFGLSVGTSMPSMMSQAFVSWPLIFFATVMLTEPLTTPPTKKLYIMYGVIVGLLFGSQYKLGPLFSTPELALVIGNIFSFIVSPKVKTSLRLTQKKQLSPHIQHFSFTPSKSFHFQPGQYLEWTLPHQNPDSRGNRRYFTIASSPTEPEVQLGIRLAEAGSSFKTALTALKGGGKMYVGQLGGDFTLPKDKNKKLVFIAGGIGVTPFRSMVQYLIDTKDKRDITLFFACSDPSEFIYQDIFTSAAKYGVKTVYVITNKNNVPKNWTGRVGYLNEEVLRTEVPDFKERDFYISGPNNMVDAYKKLLNGLGIFGKQIITDYFPGF